MQWLARCAVAFSASSVLLGACSDAALLEPRDETGGNGATRSTGGKENDVPPIPGTGGRHAATGGAIVEPEPSTGGYGGYGGYGWGGWGGYGGWGYGGTGETGGTWGTGGSNSLDGGVCASVTVQQWCASSPWTCNLQGQTTLCEQAEAPGPYPLTTSRCGYFVRFESGNEAMGNWEVVYDERTSQLVSVRARNPANGCFLVIGAKPSCSSWSTIPCRSVFPDGGAPPPPPEDAG